MKVKPILFNTEMVRAILDGRKTCTRRVLKWPYEVYEVNGMVVKHKGKNTVLEYPYLPGDILYVRETFAWCPCWDCGMDTEQGACTDHIYHSEKKEYGCYMYRASCEDNEYPSADTWHPSMHMPKEAARIWLKITDVHVERLQDITSEQIRKEGAEVEEPYILNGEEKRYAFANLWNSTIKKSDINLYGWDANPFVWVIEFERCEELEGEE